jgi:hypothetical protein
LLGQAGNADIEGDIDFGAVFGGFETNYGVVERFVEGIAQASREYFREVFQGLERELVDLEEPEFVFDLDAAGLLSGAIEFFSLFPAPFRPDVTGTEDGDE